MNCEEIKSRILMEMNTILNDEQFNRLKACLNMNFYNVTIVENSTEIMISNTYSNEEVIRKFICAKTIEGLSHRTIEQYAESTLRFLNYVHKNYYSINEDDVKYYLSYLIKKRNSMHTVENTRKFIKATFVWLYENKYISNNVFLTIKPIKFPEKKKEYLTDNEIVLLRDACKKDIRESAIVDFLLSTGIRVSEFTNLKKEDINFNSGEVTIYANKTKDWRKVYLDSAAMKHLRDYLNSRTDASPYLFVNIKRDSNGMINKMSNESVEHLLHAIANRANVDKKCTVHLFRKTLATRLYRKGMDISIIAKILGHETSATTEKYYMCIREHDIHYLYNKYAA